MDLGLERRLDVISTVSGGSVFGGAWMAARHNSVSDNDFLAQMRQELRKGFVLRSVRPRLLKTLIPGSGYSRTNVIAATFDKVFFHGQTLKDLPEVPRLCINTTILNNGQVGKFSSWGFSAWGLYLPDAEPHHQIPMPEFPIASAVAASAAFPIGLPPLELTSKHFPKDLQFRDSLAGARRLALTDGGVLENLGIQTLLKSERFGVWDMIVSDAGAAWKSWRPGALTNSIRSFAVWVLSGRTLDQIMLVMNDKQNRWARQQVIDQIRSLPPTAAFTRRKVLFVRVAQNWDSFMLGIPSYRLKELGGQTGRFPDQKTPKAIVDFLEKTGVDLSTARDYYLKLGGDAGAREVNGVSTNFTSLSARMLDRLEAHAAWQMHAAHAVYGF